MVMRIVHAADLHVDSPLSGLARYGGAPVDEIRSATRRALSNLVDMCEREGAALLLIAGDLFDGDWKDYTTGLFFAEQMARLKRCGIRVVVVRGNHDAASQISRHLALPDNVIELSHEAPETRQLSDIGVAVHGQSYARRAETEDLALAYPHAVPGLFNIGLLHTCVTGRAGHEPYAPCRLPTLLSKGYDYWALGHVHQREVLHEQPWIVFPGNLQGRHIKEVGEKGATLIDVQEGRIVGVHHRALDVVRFQQRDVVLEAEWDVDRAIDAASTAIEEEFDAAGERTLIVRVTFAGRGEAHAALCAESERWEAQLRARAAELGRVWVESVRFHTEPLVSFARLAERGDALGQLAEALEELRRCPERLQDYLGQFEDLRSKLPPEVREGPDAIRLDEPESLGSVLEEVESLLLTRLASSGQ